MENNAYKLHAARLLAVEMDKRATFHQEVEEEEAKLELQNAALQEIIRERKEELRRQKLRFSTTNKTITYTPAIDEPPHGFKRKAIQIVDVTEDDDHRFSQKLPKLMYKSRRRSIVRKEDESDDESDDEFEEEEDEEDERPLQKKKKVQPVETTGSSTESLSNNLSNLNLQKQ